MTTIDFSVCFGRFCSLVTEPRKKERKNKKKQKTEKTFFSESCKTKSLKSVMHQYLASLSKCIDLVPSSLQNEAEV